MGASENAVNDFGIDEGYLHPVLELDKIVSNLFDDIFAFCEKFCDGFFLILLFHLFILLVLSAFSFLQQKTGSDHILYGRRSYVLSSIRVFTAS